MAKGNSSRRSCWSQYIITTAITITRHYHKWSCLCKLLALCRVLPSSLTAAALHFRLHFRLRNWCCILLFFLSSINCVAAPTPRTRRLCILQSAVIREWSTLPVINCGESQLYTSSTFSSVLNWPQLWTQLWSAHFAHLVVDGQIDWLEDSFWSLFPYHSSIKSATLAQALSFWPTSTLNHHHFLPQYLSS